MYARKILEFTVRIILREPNELVSDCSDKTIKYYYNPNEKIEEELPF